MNRIFLIFGYKRNKLTSINLKELMLSTAGKQMADIILKCIDFLFNQRFFSLKVKISLICFNQSIFFTQKKAIFIIFY